MSDLLIAGFVLMLLFLPWLITCPALDRVRPAKEKKLPTIPQRKVMFQHYVQGERLLMQDWEDAFADAIKDLSYPRLVEGPPSYQHAVGFARSIQEAYPANPILRIAEYRSEWRPHEAFPQPAFGEKGWCSAADEARGRCKWQRRRA